MCGWFLDLLQPGPNEIGFELNLAALNLNDSAVCMLRLFNQGLKDVQEQLEGRSLRSCTVNCS